MAFPTVAALLAAHIASPIPEPESPVDPVLERLAYCLIEAAPEGSAGIRRAIAEAGSVLAPMLPTATPDSTAVLRLLVEVEEAAIIHAPHVGGDAVPLSGESLMHALLRLHLAARIAVRRA
jgi:hypothetical protein